MVTLRYNNVYINDYFTIASKDEENGRIGGANMYIRDYYYGEKSAEAAEGKMQRTALSNLKDLSTIELVIGGDLSNQLAIMNNTMSYFNFSFLGVYNACATFISSMIIGANMISTRELKRVGLLTSSHVLTSERQFRFPNEYGSLKACYTTTTITAAISALLTNQASNIKVVSSTVGSVVDYGIYDVANMGAIMAPAAAKVIFNHLSNSNKSMNDYDVILTGDLGILGLELLSIILREEYGITNDEKIVDAGSMMYHRHQNKYMGGSGPSVIPYVFFNKILRNNKYRHILLVGTGALHNTTMVNQHNSIPSIAHAIEIEVLYDN